MRYVLLAYAVFGIFLAMVGALIIKNRPRSVKKDVKGYIERTDDEIIAAWEKWLEKSPEPDRKYLSCGLRLFSDREFVEALKGGDKEVRDFALECPRLLAKELGTDPVEDILDSRP